MRINSMRALILLVVLLSLLTSCRWFRKPKPAPLPAKIPAYTWPAPAPPPLLEPPPIDAEVNPPVVTDLPDIGILQLPPPPEEKKRPSRPGPRTSPATEPSAAVTPAPATPAPQLRPMLSPAQRQDLERSVSDRLARAQNTLASIGGRKLSEEQEELAAQIRTFIRQAEEARTSDLLRANNLAERAVVFAAELAKRLR